MADSNFSSQYALGSTDAEHERLIRQASLLAPYTERLFVEAGIAPGQRVLDLGSGAGDVAMLVARLVGPSGQVMGVERESRSIARARTRVADAGFHNVSFVQCDVSEVTSPKCAAHKALMRLWAVSFCNLFRIPLLSCAACRSWFARTEYSFFQELSYTPFLAFFAGLPLWPAAASLLQETLRRSGTNTEIGVALHHVFQDAGLPAPTMHMEILLGSDPDFTRWMHHILWSLRPQIHPAQTFS